MISSSMFLQQCFEIERRDEGCISMPNLARNHPIDFLSRMCSIPKHIFLWIFAQESLVFSTLILWNLQPTRNSTVKRPRSTASRCRVLKTCNHDPHIAFSHIDPYAVLKILLVSFQDFYRRICHVQLYLKRNHKRE